MVDQFGRGGIEYAVDENKAQHPIFVLEDRLKDQEGSCDYQRHEHRDLLLRRRDCTIAHTVNPKLSSDYLKRKKSIATHTTLSSESTRVRSSFFAKRAPKACPRYNSLCIGKMISSACCYYFGNHPRTDTSIKREGIKGRKKILPNRKLALSKLE